MKSRLFRSIVFGLMTVLISISAYAYDRRSEGKSEKEDDEYNFNWLDTDKKIYVLQNRKFLKAKHPVLSVLGGAGFSNPYRTTYNVEGRFAYYFSEALGVELFYMYTSNTANATMQSLSNANPNLLPNIRELRQQYGGMFHWVPWYAKINVFNTVLYFDWYLGIGVGSIQSFVDTRQRTIDAPNYTQQNLLGIYLSTGHYYHITQSLIGRIDLTGAFYQAPIFGTSGEATNYSNYNFGLGIGWKI